MLILEQINKTFHSQTQRVDAVRDVSLRVPRGEIFGIIGSSGAGKSTLVRCINLLERPESGRVFVDGVELTELPARELRQVRRGIGMIFQHFNLMASRTAVENVMLPLRDVGMDKAAAREKAKGLMALVGLQDKLDAYPAQLSGGQKQRVAIARSLANDPKVLLCDEATSALDPQTTLSILQLLKDLNRQLGLTIIIITHEMAVVKEVCHKVAVMDGGQVVEEGEVFEVFARPRHPVTRGFLDTASPLNKIHRLIEEDAPVVQLRNGEKILRLTFRKQSASQALISEISRDYGIDMNIIFGDIQIIGSSPLGGMIVIASGQQQNLEKAMQYLKAQEVDVEVIKSA